MKKIKLFLVTLLSVVGVMNASAQAVITGDTHTQVVDGASGSLGGSNNNTWTSNDAYDVAGNSLTVVDNGTLNSAMTIRNGHIFLQNKRENAITINAPEGWCIAGYGLEFTTNQYASINGKKSGTLEVNVKGLDNVSFNVEYTGGLFDGLGTVDISTFTVLLQRKVNPDINDNMNNTVDGHWLWVQDTPQKGNIYKIVNATSNKYEIRAISAKHNNTVVDDDDASESSVLVNDMTKAGEWLLGDDENADGITITGVDGDKMVGIYESHVKFTVLGQEIVIGANWNQHWKIEGLQTINDVPGYYIAGKRPFGTCYLKLSDTFALIQDALGWEVGDMGWTGRDTTWPFSDGDINTVTHLWNFYSIEQYDCYVDFMTAYNAFEELYDVYYNNTAYPEYKEVYDIVNEAGKRWQGETDETREETYDIIDRMLDVIATIKGGDDSDIKPIGADFPINNPGAEHEASFDGWRSRRITTDNANISKAVKTVGNAHSDEATFELKNATMSQMVSGIKSGVYELSVYWKSDNDEAEITLQAKSSAETVKNSFFVKEKSTEDPDVNGYRKTKVEVVVVDKNVTISATANTSIGASVFLDDFKLEYVCKNYWELNEAGDTRVYRGVFLGSGKDAPIREIDPPAHPNNEAKAFVTDDVPFADITQAYFVSFEFDNSANPNGLCYTKAETTKSIKTKTTATGTATDEINVIRGNECAQLKLVDGHPYSVKYAFTADDANYTMSSFGVITEKVKEADEEGALVEKDVKVGYGTLMLPYAMELPKDEETGNPIVEVYTVGAVNEATGVLTLSPATSIAANVPYIVKHKAVGADDKAIFATSSKNQTFAPVNVTYKPGVLAGTYKKTTIKVDTNCYLLQRHGNTIGFYLISEDRVSNPFRCYLQLPAKAQNALSIVFTDEDDTTGIKEMECVDDGAVYDLSGRRVENISRPGIYIMNGKKFLVK